MTQQENIPEPTPGANPEPGQPARRTTPSAGRRRPGGQPGNQNAVTHGFYSKALPLKQRRALEAAAGLHGLGQEIAIIRLKIASILAEDPQNHRVLMQAVALLSRLVRAKQVLDKDDPRGFQNAIGNIIRDIGLPLGVFQSKDGSKDVLFSSLLKNDSPTA